MNWFSLYDEIYSSSEYTAKERFYFFSQMMCELFISSVENNCESDAKMFSLYKKIIDEFTVEIDDSSEFIRNRNNNLVIITTSQFLQLPHAPTNAVLNLADYLSSKGKQILIVNSAEFMNGFTTDLLTKTIPAETLLALPHRRASFIPEYTSISDYEYNGKHFSFFQFDTNMPDVESIRILIDYVKRLRPAFMVNVGGMSPLADIISKLLPSLCIGTNNSVCYSLADAQYIGRPCNGTDQEYLKILGKDSGNVLNGKYIYKFDESYHEITKSDLSIPENVKLLAVVGNRLSVELDDTFINTLDNILSEEIHVAFIGECSILTEKFSSYVNLSNYSHFLGFRKDLISVLSVCDLFINPVRKGGGTSAVMALKVGVPVITTTYGDIGTAVGEDFSLPDLKDYKASIERYFSDTDYYSLQSKKARELANILTDSVALYDSLFAQFDEVMDSL